MAIQRFEVESDGVVVPVHLFEDESGVVSHPLPEGGTSRDFEGPITVDGEPVGIAYPEVEDLEVGVEDIQYPYGDLRRHGLEPGLETNQRDKIQNAYLSVLALGAQGIGNGEVLLPPGYVLHVEGNWFENPDASIRPLSNSVTRLSPGSEVAVMDNADFGSRNRSAAFLVEKEVQNVSIVGRGVIRGDREIHTAVGGGEEGHCIALHSAKKVLIDGPICLDAWGDGIFVGGDDYLDLDDEFECEDITIRGVITDNCRRQGMSVLAVRRMTFSDCIFKNTGGTAPGAGFDIEPLFGYHGGYGEEGATPGYARVEDVTGENIVCTDGWRGLGVVAGAQGVSLTNIRIRNVQVAGIEIGGEPENGRPTRDVVLSNFSVEQDADAIPEDPPIAVKLSVAPGTQISDGKIRGLFSKGVYVQGFGSEAVDGQLDVTDVVVAGDIAETIGFELINVSNRTRVQGCKARQTFVGLSINNCDTVDVDDFRADGTGAQGVSLLATSDGVRLTGVTCDRCNEGVRVEDSVGVSMSGVNITNSVGIGLQLIDVVDSHVQADVSGSGSFADDTYANVKLTGATDRNRLELFVRKGANVNKPKYGVHIASGTANDLRGSDVRNSGETSDWQIDSPHQVMDPRPILVDLDCSHPDLVVTNLTVTPDDTDDPFGNNVAVTVRETVTDGMHTLAWPVGLVAGRTYRVSAKVRAVNATFWMWMTGTPAPLTVSDYFPGPGVAGTPGRIDPWDGALDWLDSSTGVLPEFVGYGNAWCEIAFRFTAVEDGAGTLTLVVHQNADFPDAYAGETDKGIDLASVQVVDITAAEDVPGFYAAA